MQKLTIIRPSIAGKGKKEFDVLLYCRDFIVDLSFRIFYYNSPISISYSVFSFLCEVRRGEFVSSRAYLADW